MLTRGVSNQSDTNDAIYAVNWASSDDFMWPQGHHHHECFISGELAVDWQRRRRLKLDTKLGSMNSRADDEYFSLPMEPQNQSRWLQFLRVDTYQTTTTTKAKWDAWITRFSPEFFCHKHQQKWGDKRYHFAKTPLWYLIVMKAD